MSTSFEQFRQTAIELPEEERRQLAESLLSTLEPDSELDDLWKAEVERRIDQVDAGTATTYSWEEVKSRLHARYVQ